MDATHTDGFRIGYSDMTDAGLDGDENDTTNNSYAAKGYASCSHAFELLQQLLHGRNNAPAEQFLAVSLPSTLSG